MSRHFDCPSCGHSQKEIVVPHDGFGYFISHEAIEMIECNLGIRNFALSKWLKKEVGARSETFAEAETPMAGRCTHCGFVAALDENGRVRTTKTLPCAMSNTALGYRDLYWCAHYNEPVIVDGDGKCSECSAPAVEDEDGHVFLGHILKPY